MRLTLACNIGAISLSSVDHTSLLGATWPQRPLNPPVPSSLQRRLPRSSENSDCNTTLAADLLPRVG